MTAQPGPCSPSREALRRVWALSHEPAIQATVGTSVGEREMCAGLGPGLGSLPSPMGNALSGTSECMFLPPVRTLPSSDYQSECR